MSIRFEAHLTAFTRSLLLVLVALANSAFAQPRFDFAATPGNLSKDVVPSRYWLDLDLDPARETFSGTATIAISIARTTPSFEIHAHELTAGSAIVTTARGVSRSLRVQPGKLSQAWQLSAPDGAPFEAGDYKLRIEYTGKVHATGAGLFRVPFSARGQREVMLATQLEAVSARMVFPCFDEPAFRAVFDISIRAPSTYAVYSNMPGVVSKSKAGVTEHRFRPTPAMPTYLVAVTVGRFATSKGRASGIPLRIFSAEGKEKQAAYAMTVSKQVIPYFTRYFGVPYALPKLDQLAVPGVRDGAMEDWGLISYSEDALLFDPERSSFAAQRYVFNIVAHEIAHQWFGNLVTAASWEEIWLNEAFATWMEIKASAHFNPSWNERLRRRPGLDKTMEGDAGSATRAIRSGAVSESSVFDVFDPITYDKGGAVLAMLEEWIGAEAFRAGLVRYMKDRQLSNATAGDLWHQMQLASGKKVSEVASSWTDQQGFPVVRVTSRCIDGKTIIDMAQSRFTLGPQPTVEQLWKIPIVLERGGQRIALLLGESRGSATLEGCSNTPVLANPDGRGFYRVSYDASALQNIGARFSRLSPTQQATLLSDTFALAQAGHVSMSAYFTLLAAIPGASVVGRSMLYPLAMDHLKFLSVATAGTPAHAGVRSAALALLKPALTQAGWVPVKSESSDISSLRSQLISYLAYFGDAEVIARAGSLFDASLEKGGALSPAVRTAVINAAGAGADRTRFDRLLALLQSTDSEEDRWIYARSLASNQDETLAAALLQMTTSTQIASNVGTRIPGLIAAWSPHGALAYRFTVDHWKKLAAISGNLFGESSQLLPASAAAFNDSERARQLMIDQTREAGADGKVSAERMASRIELHSLVRQREAATLESFLASWKPADGRPAQLTR